MVQVPVAGGLILFSIAAAGSALQTFFSASEKKKPNQRATDNDGATPRRV